MALVHLLNGIEVAPTDIHKIGFKTVFSDVTLAKTPDEVDNALNVDSVTFQRDGREIILSHLDTFGTTVGIPYVVYLQLSLVFVDYYVDLTEEMTVGDYYVTVKVKRRNDFSDFYSRSRGLSFEAMAQMGAGYVYTDIPYKIVSPVTAERALLLGLSTFTIGRLVIEEVRTVFELIQQAIAAIIPSVGLGVVINIGAIIFAIIRVVLHAIYLIALILLLKKLIDEILNILFPKTRMFKACKVKELLTKSCELLGFSFSSSILDALPGLTILPTPMQRSKEKGLSVFQSVYQYFKADADFAYTNGHPSGLDTVPDLWSLVNAICIQFNARCTVVNGVVRIERWDFFKNNATTEFESYLTNQDRRVNEYSLNTFDLWRRYYIHYATDFSDMHAVDFADYVAAEYSTEQIVTTADSSLVTLKGLADVDIPFALGKRYDKNTLLTKVLKAFATLVDKIAQTSYASKINDDNGMLVISDQYFKTTKMLYVNSSGKQPDSYGDLISASALWDKYHYINQIQQNGYKIFRNVVLPINEKKFASLQNNNWILIDGKECELLEYTLNEHSRTLTCTYREPYNYEEGKLKTIEL